MLEQRIAALTSTLESRERPAAGENSEHLEGALRALSDRLDRMPVGNDSASAFAHLEQRVSYLLERLEASSDHRAGNLGRVEEGLQDILRHLETQHASRCRLALADTGPQRARNRAEDSGLIDIVKRELSDIRFSQSETDRHTQDSLEAVHNTLGHVVDRLAMIEGDLRTVRVRPGRRPPSCRRAIAHPRLLRPPSSRKPPRRAWRCRRKPSPNCPIPPQRRSISPPPRADFQLAAPPGQPRPAVAAPRHQRNSGAAYRARAPCDRAGSAARSPARTGHAAERPGRFAVGAHRGFRKRDQRNSAPPPKQPVSTSSFIAAARRAAQAAAAAAPPTPRPAAGARRKAGDQGRQGKEPSTITSKIRSLLVGASVVVIVLGTFKMAMTLLDGGSAPHDAGDGEFQRSAGRRPTARR